VEELVMRACGVENIQDTIQSNKLQTELVYNLTVEGDHVYFANGQLVGNCDALSYIQDFGARPLEIKHAQPILQRQRTSRAVGY
jgi:hypothetical protein